MTWIYNGAIPMRYYFADLSLDTDAGQLRQGESALHLSPKAMDLLSILVSEARRVVPKAGGRHLGSDPAIWGQTRNVKNSLKLRLTQALKQN